MKKIVLPVCCAFFLTPNLKAEGTPHSKIQACIENCSKKDKPAISDKEFDNVIDCQVECTKLK